MKLSHNIQHWAEMDRMLAAAIGDDGGLMGSVQVELFDKIQKFGGTAYLYALWVEKAYRKQDVAKALMTEDDIDHHISH